MFVKNPVYCFDSRPCFARDKKRLCYVLTDAYEKDGDCPFCKPRRESDTKTSEQSRKIFGL